MVIAVIIIVVIIMAVVVGMKVKKGIVNSNNCYGNSIMLASIITHYGYDK